MNRLQRLCFLVTLLSCAGLGGCASLPFQPGLAPRSKYLQSNPSFSASRGAEQDSRRSQPTGATHGSTEETNGPSEKDNAASSQPTATKNSTESAQNAQQGAAAIPAVEGARPSAVSINLLVEELEAEGLLTPENKAQLVEDLCRTPPDLWPAVVDFFRASVELRRKRGLTTVKQVEIPSGNSPLTPVADSTLPSVATQALGSELRPTVSSVQSVALTLSDRPGPPEEGRAFPTSPTTLPPQPRQPEAILTTAAFANSLDRATQSNPTPKQPVGEATVSDVSARGADSITAPFRASDETWESYLRQAVNSLEHSTHRDESAEIRLRLLELALGNRENALQPIPETSPALQEFWSETLFALGLLQDSHLNPDPKLRLAEARRHLQNGIRRLGEECPLEVTGLAFVTSVQSWGVYEAFDKYEFTCGQKVLLYAEVENLSAESTPKGYRTSWRSSYQILDSTGKEVARYEYAPNEEYCRRPRRDFFIGCELSFPKDVAAGRYVLRLTVVDLISNRVGQGTIEFTLRAQPVK
ncbi:hypothetical protein [Thermogutta sp.]|uniref:hypothetical protein n=1 Tax=Thermogutta sp. TaxID=1962930 RepID=UPI00321F6961